MTCQTCGRPAENGQQTHWIGCAQIRPAAEEPQVEEFSDEEQAEFREAAGRCEHEGCRRFKWSDSPRTKFCADHKDPKSREK
jgi:hypothetical protein